MANFRRPAGSPFNCGIVAFRSTSGGRGSATTCPRRSKNTPARSFSAAGRELCRDWPDHVYPWQRDGFDLPDKTVMLAEGDSFPVQAFSYNNLAYALQFHMDVTHATMCRWTTRGHERMTLPNAKPREA